MSFFHRVMHSILALRLCEPTRLSVTFSHVRVHANPPDTKVKHSSNWDNLVKLQVQVSGSFVGQSRQSPFEGAIPVSSHSFTHLFDGGFRSQSIKSCLSGHDNVADIAPQI
jgi:hypothetical protein